MGHNQLHIKGPTRSILLPRRVLGSVQTAIFSWQLMVEPCAKLVEGLNRLVQPIIRDPLGWNGRAQDASLVAYERFLNRRSAMEAHYP